MTFLIALDTPVGSLLAGDDFYFRRTTMVGRDQQGWVTARSFVQTKEGPLVNGTDRRGRVRTIRVEEITRIRKHRADRRLSTKGARS